MAAESEAESEVEEGLLRFEFAASPIQEREELRSLANGEEEDGNGFSDE